MVVGSSGQCGISATNSEVERAVVNSQRKMEATSFTARGTKKDGQRSVTIPLISFFTALGHTKRLLSKSGRQAPSIEEKREIESENTLVGSSRRQTDLECKKMPRLEEPQGEGSEWSSDLVRWGSDKYGTGKGCFDTASQ